MKPEEKAIMISKGKYKCPNCNRRFQIKELRNRKNYECPKCESVLELNPNNKEVR